MIPDKGRGPNGIWQYSDGHKGTKNYKKEAFFPEAEITVDASCCAGVTPETHNAALAAMKMCQINVIGE